MDYSELIKNISLIFASWTAIYGIGQWRREHKGKRQAELAEDTLTLFYEAQDAIHHIRNPFSFGGEGSSRKPGANETAEEKEAYDKAYVVFERINTHLELFNKIHAIRYRFMAQFGVNAVQPFDELRKIINKIQISARHLGQLWARRNIRFRTQQQEDDHITEIRKHEAVFWEDLEEKDPINPKLAKCIAEIERTCRDVLSEKGTLFSLVNRQLSVVLKKKLY